MSYLGAYEWSPGLLTACFGTAQHCAWPLFCQAEHRYSPEGGWCFGPLANRPLCQQFRVQGLVRSRHVVYQVDTFRSLRAADSSPDRYRSVGRAVVVALRK
jgi:hypothetical protein